MIRTRCRQSCHPLTSPPFAQQKHDFVMCGSLVLTERHRPHRSHQPRFAHLDAELLPGFDPSVPVREAARTTRKGSERSAELDGNRDGNAR